jgi:hypothetical protein
VACRECHARNSLPKLASKQYANGLFRKWQG